MDAAIYPATPLHMGSAFSRTGGVRGVRACPSSSLCAISKHGRMPDLRSLCRAASLGCAISKHGRNARATKRPVPSSETCVTARYRTIECKTPTPNKKTRQRTFMRWRVLEERETRHSKYATDFRVCQLVSKFFLGLAHIFGRMPNKYQKNTLQIAELRNSLKAHLSQRALAHGWWSFLITPLRAYRHWFPDPRSSGQNG